MEGHVLKLFLFQLKQTSLTERKLFLLQRQKFRCFTPEQFVEIVNCFPHSHDKVLVIKLLACKIGGKLKSADASRLIKSAVYSKDSHVEFMSNIEGKKFAALTFDSNSDRSAAYEIFRQINGTIDPENNENMDFDKICAQDEPNMSTVFDFIENAAKQNIVRSKSVFDLQVLTNLNSVNEYVSDSAVRTNIEQEVDRRHTSKENFVIPSRITSICMNLKPGRRIAMGDRGSYKNLDRRRKAVSVYALNSEPYSDSPNTNETVAAAEPNPNIVDDSRVAEKPENPQRSCNQTVLERSKMFGEPRYKKYIRNDFVTGYFYNRNKASAR